MKSLVAAACIVTLAQAAHAQAAPDIQALREEIRQLREQYEQRIKALEAKLDAAQPQPAAPAPAVAAPAPAQAAAGKGLNLQTSLILSGLYSHKSRDPSDRGF